MFESVNYKDTIVGHKGYVIYHNDHGEYRVENESGRTIDLVFYTRSDAINWINSVS